MPQPPFLAVPAVKSSRAAFGPGTERRLGRAALACRIEPIVLPSPLRNLSRVPDCCNQVDFWKELVEISGRYAR